jgi:hypothetical protein
MFLNVPVTHSVHVPAFSDPKPALQVQATSAVLYVSEFEFAGHAIHELTPVATPYVPTMQLVQTVPAMMFWNFPAGHTVQELSPTCEYTPTPQDSHAAGPVAFLYVPAAHCVHAWFVYVAPTLQVHAASAVLLAAEFV